MSLFSFVFCWAVECKNWNNGIARDAHLSSNWLAPLHAELLSRLCLSLIVVCPIVCCWPHRGWMNGVPMMVPIHPVCFDLSWWRMIIVFWSVCCYFVYRSCWFWVNSWFYVINSQTCQISACFFREKLNSLTFGLHFLPWLPRFRFTPKQSLLIDIVWQLWLNNSIVKFSFEIYLNRKIDEFKWTIFQTNWFHWFEFLEPILSYF